MTTLCFWPYGFSHNCPEKKVIKKTELHSFWSPNKMGGLFGDKDIVEKCLKVFAKKTFQIQKKKTYRKYHVKSFVLL